MKNKENIFGPLEVKFTGTYYVNPNTKEFTLDAPNMNVNIAFSNTKALDKVRSVSENLPLDITFLMVASHLATIINNTQADEVQKIKIIGQINRYLLQFTGTTNGN